MVAVNKKGPGGSLENSWRACAPQQKRRYTAYGCAFPSAPSLILLDCAVHAHASRNGNAFATFQDLALRLGKLFPNNRVVLDGEIVCLDESGRPQFTNLLFHRGEPSFIAFDLLYETGKDLRREQLLDRKGELRRLLGHVRKDEPLMYADHIEQYGEALYQQACDIDLEGIVAKLKSGPYVSERENRTGGRY